MKKQVALVTGGNRGIGLEIARQLSLKGIHVMIGCRNEAKGRQAIEQLHKAGAKAELSIVDVERPDSIDRIMAYIRAEYGRLDILINNAGVILDRGVSILDVKEEVMQATFATNFFGALHCIQTAVPIMRERQFGRIVNISSGLGSFEVHQGLLGLRGSVPAYRISKTMLNALTCLAACDTADWGITINAVCPGQVRTDMGGQDAPLTVAEGADTAVWLATLGSDSPTGGFFRNRMRANW